MQYISGMDAVAPPLPPDIWDALPAEGRRALTLAVQAQVVALQTEAAALHVHCRELQARLGQNSSNSSQPPSAAPPHAPRKRKRQMSPTGRRRGGQPGHPGRFQSLLPMQQADVVNLDETGWRQEKQRAWLLTVAASCRQHGRPLLDFLAAAGEAAVRGTPAPSLLPAPSRG